MRPLFVVNLESEVRGQRDWSPGTQLPGRPRCEGQRLRTTSQNCFRGSLEGVALGKKKREKEVGVEWEVRHEAPLSTTHTTAGTLQPSWMWRYRKARTIFPGIGCRATDRQQSSASLAPP